jgi:diphosphomevalonate decarboxylase
MQTVTALAHPNIAFIKYWGNRDEALRLPVNGSLSMNLDGLFTRTQVSFDPALTADTLLLNQTQQSGPPLQRVSRFLDHVRGLAGTHLFARVVSENNFPTGAGIASSAAAFAALSLAASSAAGLQYSEPELSRLARLGSGSAARSVPGGFVEWQVGKSEADSFAFSVAAPGYWDLVDCIAIVQAGHKPVGSTEGHALAGSSPLQAARVADAERRLELCRRAILERCFSDFAEIVELDSNMMHAVMMTSQPALFYWEPASLTIMKAVRHWRADGRPVCYTLDAGPNVHVLTTADHRDWVAAALAALPGVTRVLTAAPGGPARRVED